MHTNSFGIILCFAVQMFEFHIAVGKAKDMAEAEALKRRQAEMRATLERQMQEREHAKKLEHDEEIEYFHQEQVRVCVPAAAALLGACPPYIPWQSMAHRRCTRAHTHP